MKKEKDHEVGTEFGIIGAQTRRFCVLVDTELLGYAEGKATNKRLRSNGRTTFRARPRSSNSECESSVSVLKVMSMACETYQNPSFLLCSTSLELTTQVVVRSAPAFEQKARSVDWAPKGRNRWQQQCCRSLPGLLACLERLHSKGWR